MKELGCVDLSMGTMHLKDPLVPFRIQGSALSLPPFLLSHALPLFNNGRRLRQLYEKTNFMALNVLLCRCAFKPSFIHGQMIKLYLYNCFYCNQGISMFNLLLSLLIRHCNLSISLCCLYNALSISLLSILWHIDLGEWRQ